MEGGADEARRCGSGGVGSVGGVEGLGLGATDVTSEFPSFS